MRIPVFGVKKLLILKCDIIYMTSNPKQQVTLITFTTVLAGFSTASIISFTDPSSASLLTFVFFYLSLFLLALGVLTLAGLAVRQWLNPGHYLVNLSSSFRQGFLLALLVIISFILLSKQILFWWVEGTLILLFGVIELFLNLKI